MSIRLITVETTRQACALLVRARAGPATIGIERRRQGPGRDELEDQVRDAERGEERVEVAARRTCRAMTTRRTQPRTRETRNAPETMRPARARPAVRGHGAGVATRPRVRLPIGGLEPAGRDVGVDLGRREVLVAEQLLDDAQVRAAVEQVRRERVAQRVRRDADAAGRPAGDSRSSR